MTKPLKFTLLATLVVVAGIGAYALGTALRPKPTPAGTALENPVEISGLHLVDQNGEDFDLAEDLGGDVALVFFGYTRCPDVCPFTMAQLGRVYTDLGEPEDLRVLMVTVDPAHDTPEVVGSYVERFHPSFVGLTGSNPQVAAAAKEFFVGYGGTGADLVHTEYVAVLDRAGRMSYIYGSDVVRELATDLPHLMREL